MFLFRNDFLHLKWDLFPNDFLHLKWDLFPNSLYKLVLNLKPILQIWETYPVRDHQTVKQV